MTTILKISRSIAHNEDVLRIERTEPENDSRTSFVLPIDGSVEIEAFGENVSQLIERDTPKKPVKKTYEDDCSGLSVTLNLCPVCGYPTRPDEAGCANCLQRIDWGAQ